MSNRGFALIIALLIMALLVMTETVFAIYPAQWETVWQNKKGDHYDVDVSHIWHKSVYGETTFFLREYKKKKWSIYIANYNSSFDSFTWNRHWKGSPEIDIHYAIKAGWKEYHDRNGIGQFKDGDHLLLSSTKKPLMDWNLGVVIFIEDFLKFQTHRVIFLDKDDPGPIVPEYPYTVTAFEFKNGDLVRTYQVPPHVTYE